MTEFLIYDLKVAALVAVFYMFYRLLLSRDALHRLNRVVLLTTAMASFVLPLCVITVHHTVVVPQAAGSVTAGRPVMTVIDSSQPWWQQVAVAVFFAGVAVTLGHQLWSVGQVMRLIRRSEKHPQADGTIVCVVDAPPFRHSSASSVESGLSPFSWLRYIVLNRQDYESPDPAIMAHERGHIRQRHSLDVLLVDTFTALQWFNPAMWMLRQDLRAIHEYEADAAVLSQGINMRQYQYLLIQKAVVACGYSVANGISHSTLKNRITMMLNNKKSSRTGWHRACPYIKLLALVPIVGIALALNAETVTHYVYEQPQKKVVKRGRKAGQVKMGTKTIEVQADTLYAIDTSEGKLHANPLIIIDGKRASADQFRSLDPKTIDHIDVLKEKSGVELYGEDGKNGVIIITTKTDNATPADAPSLPNSDDVEFLDSGVASVDSTGVEFNEAETEHVSDNGVVFDVVEHMPEFPGGINAMMEFLMKNVHYPEAAVKVGKQGRVLVSFIVETDGRITTPKVVKKVSDELDAEALRVVGSMPKWKPGKQNGKAVRVKFTLPITFRLN